MDHYLHANPTTHTALKRALTPGLPASRVQKTKQDKMRSASLDTDAVRVPMAIEATGRLSTETVKFVNMLVDDATAGKMRSSAFRGADRPRASAFTRGHRQQYLDIITRAISVALANADGYAAAKILRDAQSKHPRAPPHHHPAPLQA
jgi:hypothetical protein